MDIQRKLLIRDMRRLLQVLPHWIRWKVTLLFLLMILLAVTEVLSIFSMSFMALSIATPDSLMAHPLAQRCAKLPGLSFFFSDPRYFTFMASCLVALLILLKNLLTALTSWRSSMLGEEISLYTGEKIMGHFLKSDYMAHMSGDSTAMFQALNWRGQLGQFMINILNVYTYLITALALVVTVFSATPSVILSVIATVSVIVYAVYRSMKTTIDRSAKNMAETDTAQNRAAMTAMRGIREVLLYGQQKTFLERYLEPGRRSRRARAFMHIAPPIPTWILEFFGFFSIPVTIGVLLALRDADMMTITAVITLLMLVAWRVLPILNRSLSCIVSLRGLRPMAMNCLDRLEQIDKANLPDPPQPDPNFVFDRTIAIEHGYFTYPGSDHDSLSDVNLVIEKGEQVGLIGASGSGKTTLAGILCGLVSLREGSFSVDGRSLTPEGRAAYVRKVGYVSQSPYIFNGTIADNVAFSSWGRPHDPERVLRACRMAALDIVETDPRGIDYPIGDNGAGLSGGQAQRVSIARALYAMPDVLILDESTSALDLGTEQAIMETIESLRGQLTIIIIAHRLSTVERCHRLFWIENGRVRAEGAPGVLLPEYTHSLMSRGDAADQSQIAQPAQSAG